ncbi:MAG: primosomal protein N', partial [Clostridia bacterium]|nr:primosomal protein N' [Clostridia bacterium]
DEVPSSDLFVYEYLRENGEISLDALRRRFGAGVELKLKHLCTLGIAQKKSVLEEAKGEKTERVWQVAISHTDAYALIDGEIIKDVKLTSEAQKKALAAILESELPMTATEIKERAGVTDTPLKTLLNKGIVTTLQLRQERNPYGNAKYLGRTPIHLNDEQSAAMKTLSSLVDSGEAKAALLYGVTGSGKTCVMLSLIDKLLDQGRGVIVLQPEIALTPQSVSIFCARYGERVAVIHSGLSAGERYDAYCRIRDGRADVVIGTRSAVFSPVKNLGAIIIDEEQEHTYKSDQNPKYHTRDIARYRCAHNKALMLLSSATPSLESYQKAKEGVYTLITLKHRFGAAKLPEVKIADMRSEVQGGSLSPLGEELMGELCRVTNAREQAVLFINRRGYNHFISCRSCGEAVTCPSCSVAMTYHTRRGTWHEGDLVCHWCGKRIPLPRECPNCHSEHLARMGFGTQRVEEELQTLLPKANILRMDTDTTTTKFAYDELLGRFRAHEADVLLGTQMVTKGHDFPDVTLVGVLLADASLYLDDYRAAEKTFAMLTQVIGRAGRADKEGMAVIQTNNPDSEIIRLACAQDYESFYEREIRLRKLLTFPPFCDIALLTVTGAYETELLRATTMMAQMIKEMAEGDYKDVTLVTFGPFEAPVYRVDNKYRMRMVLKCKLTRRTLSMLAELLSTFGQRVSKKVTLSIDLNPSSL